jgi:hypothetical protein
MEPKRDDLPGAWARLKQDVSCGLRRGAWYRVVGLTPDDAVLQVPRRERVRVPRRFLQTLFARPRHWTVVPRPSHADEPPDPWRSRYAVCPACRARAAITSYSADMRCPKCEGLFGIAWEERYLNPG